MDNISVWRRFSWQLQRVALWFSSVLRFWDQSRQGRTYFSRNRLRLWVTSGSFAPKIMLKSKNSVADIFKIVWCLLADNCLLTTNLCLPSLSHTNMRVHSNFPIFSICPECQRTAFTLQKQIYKTGKRQQSCLSARRKKTSHSQLPLMTCQS